jgi:hypothetical protein
MKMLAEYVEKALHFEQLATSEKDPKLKAALQRKHELTENWRQNGPCVNPWRPPKIQTETSWRRGLNRLATKMPISRRRLSIAS